LLLKEFPVKTLWLTSIGVMGMLLSMSFPNVNTWSQEPRPNAAELTPEEIDALNRTSPRPDRPDWSTLHFDDTNRIVSFRYELFGEKVHVFDKNLLVPGGLLFGPKIAASGVVEDREKLAYLERQLTNSLLRVPNYGGGGAGIGPRGKLSIKTTTAEFEIYLGLTAFGYNSFSPGVNSDFYNPGLAAFLQREIKEQTDITMGQDWVDAVAGKKWLDRIDREAEWLEAENK
jgi:hypothetical protein